MNMLYHCVRMTKTIVYNDIKPIILDATHLACDLLREIVAIIFIENFRNGGLLTYTHKIFILQF